MADAIRILGVDEDRAHQAVVAQAFNQAGLFYRFVTDRKKVEGGLKQLKPDALLVCAEPGSELLSAVLEAVNQQVEFAQLPIVLLAKDTRETQFVGQLRTGIVAFAARPFDPAVHPQWMESVILSLPSRSGTVSGAGPSATLALLVEHVRKSRRSGVVTFDARAVNEGRATFALGRLEAARFMGLKDVEALVAMVAQPQARFSFTEVGGGGSEGAGVVIEVGETSGSEEVLVGVALEALPEEDEPLGAFEIPLEKPQPTPVVPQVATHAPQDARGAVKLLLVDDDESLCTMFSTLFSKQGYQVSTAADGVEGFDAALRNEFHAVIADLNMPRLDGWGMLKMLRDDFRTRELPVAFISAHDDYRESLKALNAGAQAYFNKGGRLEALVGQVRKLLEPREQAAAGVKSRSDFQMDIAAVGPQWLLKQLVAARFTGRLEARDGFAAYQLYVEGGNVKHAAAAAGRYTAEAERAFNAFVASRAAEGALHHGAFPSPQSLFLSTEVLIERACTTLNENEQRVREGLMVSATHIEINDALYEVYRRIGPQQHLAVAKLICEDRVPPREVIAQLDTSPIDVEETLKDLVRRGVVQLRRG